MFRPDPKLISDKETLGRRVFTKSPYADQDGPGRRVKIDIFLPKDKNEDGLSFDRLGIRDRDFGETAKFLTPIAKTEAARREPPRPFTGWLGIKANKMRNLEPQPNPIEEEPANPYHALVPLEKYREDIHAENLAFRLATLALELPLFPPVEAEARSAG